MTESIEALLEQQRQQQQRVPTVTTIARGHVVMLVGQGWDRGDQMGWVESDPGSQTEVCVSASNQAEALRTVRESFPSCDEVVQQRREICRAEARFMERIKEAMDRWAAEVPEEGVQWPGCLHVSVAYRIQAKRPATTRGLPSVPHEDGPERGDK